MRGRRPLLGSVVLGLLPLAANCAGSSPTAGRVAASASASASAAAPPPTVATPARWFVAPRPGAPVLSRRLPDQRVVRLGQGSERWVADAKGNRTESEFLPVVPLHDLRLEGAGILGVGADGSLWSASEPLGRLTRAKDAKSALPLAGPAKDAEALRPEQPSGEPARPVAYALGRQALFAIAPDGVLRRAANPLGQGTDADLVPVALPAGVRARQVASDRAGAVVVFGTPHQYLVSRDDGATFRPLPSPGFGRLESDDDGILLGGRFRLQGDAWATWNAPPSPADVWTDSDVTGGWTTDRKRRVRPARNGHELRLAGERLVHVRRVWGEPCQPNEDTGECEGGTPGTASLAVGLIGGAEGAPRPIPPKARVWADGAGGRVWVAVSDDGRVEVLETSDNGASWRALGNFRGQLHRISFSDEDEELDGLAVAGDGLVVGPLCRDANYAHSECVTHVLSASGSWRHIDGAFRRRTVDPATGTVFAYDEAAQQVVSFSTRSEEVTRWGGKLPLSSSVGARALRALAPMGPDRVRVFTEDEWRDVGPSGAGPVSALPAPFRRAAFAGPHGLALTYDGFALETHDGGATFARVLVPDAPLPSPSTVGLRGCRLAGCDFGAAARVGWEYASPAAEPLSVARATPAATPAKVLRCKVSGPPTKRKERLRAGDNLDQRVALGWNPDLTTPTRSYAFGLAHAGELLGAFLATPEQTDGDSDDYPYEKLFGQRPAYMTLRRVGAPRVVQATIPPPKSTTTWTTRRFQVESDAGVGFATLRFRTPAEGSQTYSAIDATLWAYDAASDKSVSAQLNGLPSFRVGQVGMGAFFAPVTGGFVFLAPTGPLRSYEIGSPAVSMRRPPGSHDWTQAARAGTMLALLAGGGERTTIALTGDRGASWTVGTFGLDNPQLGVTGGRVVVTGGIGTQGYVIPLNPSTKLDGDLPPWKPAVLSGLRVCPATDAGAPISLTLGPGELEIVRKDPEGADEATPMEVSQERVRVRSDGSVCMSALLGEEMWGIAVAMPGGAGQLVESDPASDAGGMMVSPLACEPL